MDKYPVNEIGSHKKYIHMKCGCCKTLFIGCEVIGKKAQPNRGAPKKYIHMTCGCCKTLLQGLNVPKASEAKVACNQIRFLIVVSSAHGLKI